MDKNKTKSVGEIEFPFDSLNKKLGYYDLELYNPVHWKKKPNGKHEFGFDLERIIPSEGEVRLLGNRHRDCRYYSLGKLIHVK